MMLCTVVSQQLVKHCESPGKDQSDLEVNSFKPRLAYGLWSSRQLRSLAVLPPRSSIHTQTCIWNGYKIKISEFRWNQSTIRLGRALQVVTSAVTVGVGLVLIYLEAQADALEKANVEYDYCYGDYETPVH
jgi:hypothetical protein